MNMVGGCGHAKWEMGLMGEKMKKNEYGYEFGRYEGRIGTRVAMHDRIGCIFPVFLFQIFASFL